MKYKNYKPDGYAQIITLKCPPGMTKKDLQKWWWNHAEKVKRIPEIKFYTIYFFNSSIYSFVCVSAFLLNSVKLYLPKLNIQPLIFNLLCIS